MEEVEYLYDKFENLDEEKKKRIVDACIEEFSKNGYKNASTNSIVKNAEISKGILFHYFGSKKSLYLYIFDYVMDFLTNVIYKRMVNLPADFFERSIQIGLIKIKSACEYPAEYKFLIEAITHTPEEAKQEILERYEKVIAEGMSWLLKDIDTLNFRKDMDKGKAMELIKFALEGVSRKYLKCFKDKSADDIMSELETLSQSYYEYIDILKKGVLEQSQCK